MTERSPRLALLLSGADFFLRLAFFIAVPAILVLLAQMFTLTGAFINIGLMLLVFAGRELVLGKAARYPILKRVLRRHLRFEAYYREHPPRPFVYYMCYPLLFPFWLLNREARREFLLYKGYTVVSLIVLAVTGTYQYFHLWQPELGLAIFLRAIWMNLLVETFVVLTFLLPIATTVVGFTLARKRKRLLVLLGLAVVAATLSALGTAARGRKHHAIVPVLTQVRLVLRSKADPARAGVALYKALRAAEANPGLLKELGPHGRVEGDALEAAHAELEKFYKEDEAHAFTVAVYPVVKPRFVIITFWTKRQKTPPILLAVDGSGKVFTRGKNGELPPDLAEALKDLSPP